MLDGGTLVQHLFHTLLLYQWLDGLLCGLNLCHGSTQIDHRTFI